MNLEAGLRALLDHGSAGAALQDSAGRYLFATRDFEEAHGLPTGAMAGAVDAELLPPEAAAVRAMAQREALASGRARFDYAIDGRPVCGDVVALAQRDRVGIVLRAVEHDALQPSDELRIRLQEAERRGRIGSWVWELASDLVVWSPEMFRIYGRDDDGEAVPLEDALAYQDAEDRDAVVGHLRASAATGEPFAFEHRIFTGDARVRWMQCHGTPEADARGHVVRVRGTDQDVTERHVVRDQLRRLHRRSQHILESVSEGIVGVNRHAEITFVNGAAMRMLGRTREQSHGVALHELVLAGGNDDHPLLQTLTDGRERHVERGTVLQAHGQRLPVDFTCTPLARPGQAEGAVVALRDRSLRDQYETQIAQTMAALSESDAHRANLLVNLVAAQELERRRIAGEIHDDAVQSMSAVALRTERLADELDGEAAATLRRLQDVVRDATGRLRQLLVQLQPPELATGIAPAIEAYMTASTLPFAHVLDDRLTAEPSMATRVVLYRIAQEALRNVVKHARARTVRIELVGIDDGVRLTIVDDGVGAAAGALRSARPGHLGLETMRYRAELAGGVCEIRGTPGVGTTVTVVLPWHGEEAP